MMKKSFSNQAILMVLIAFNCIMASAPSKGLINEKFGPVIQDSLKTKLDDFTKNQALAGGCRVICKVSTKSGERYYSGYDGRTNERIIDFGIPVEIGSCSKMFTAAAIFRMIEQNKLSLNTRLTEILPNKSLYKGLLEIDGKDYIDSVRILNLLNHSSGFPDYFLKDEKLEFAEHGDSTLRMVPSQLISLAKRINKPQFAPGAKFEYCNVNYILLGLIIEKISNKPYQQYIQENILKPLNLKHTWFGSINPPVNRAKGYYNKVPSQMPATFAWAAGEMIASLDDMQFFISSWYDGKAFHHSSTIESLKAEHFQDMGSGGIFYGMGVVSINKKSFGHAGETFGSSTYIGALPNGHSFAIAIDDAAVSSWIPAIYLTEILTGEPVK